MAQLIFREPKPTVLELQVRQARRAVLAAMETGNHNKARTEIRELADHSVEHANALRLDVLGAYGVSL